MEEPFQSFIEEVAQPDNEVELNENAQQYLLSSTRWTMFLSVLGFIFSGILCLAAFGFFFSGAITGIYATAFELIFLIFIALNFYLLFLLYNVTQKIKKGIVLKNPQMIEEAFSEQKRLFKWLVISQIAYLIAGFMINIFIHFA